MILICYGTRPEYIKIEPIINILKKNKIIYKLLFTGQHIDIGNFDYDYKIDILEGENRLDSIIQSIMNCDKKIFNEISYVMIQGDTSSAFALALSSFHRNIKIIHLEAGLRTYDIQNPYPEEFYRQSISRMSSINLCPTEFNRNNLINEKCYGINYVVGNTIIDNIKNKINIHNISLKSENKILITLHRRENHIYISEYFRIISELALKYKYLEFIIPIHPNPNVKNNISILKNITILDPLDHIDLLKLIGKSILIISDSGGIQEESSFMNKRVIVCRKITERQESIGIHSFMCEEPSKLEYIFDNLINLKQNETININCPYGSGDSAEKIFEIIKYL